MGQRAGYGFAFSGGGGIGALPFAIRSTDDQPAVFVSIAARDTYYTDNAGDIADGTDLGGGLEAVGIGPNDGDPVGVTAAFIRNDDNTGWEPIATNFTGQQGDPGTDGRSVNTLVGGVPLVTATTAIDFASGATAVADGDITRVTIEGGAPTPPPTPVIVARHARQDVSSAEEGTITIVEGDTIVFDGSSAADVMNTDFVRLATRWDFGDTLAGVARWPSNLPESSRDLNSFVSKSIAPHRFQTAGTFTVRMRIRTLTGQEATASMTVVVQSRDTVYPLANRVYLHMGTPGDVPVGATTRDVSTQGFPSFNSSEASPQMYLLRRGDDFSGIGAPDINVNGGQHAGRIVDYDTGARPIVAGTAAGYFSPNSASEIDWPTDWVFEGLDAEDFVTRNVTNTIFFNDGRARSGVSPGAAIEFWYESALPDGSNPVPEVVAAYRWNRMTGMVNTDVVTNSETQISTLLGGGLAFPVILNTSIGTPTVFGPRPDPLPDRVPEHGGRMFSAFGAAILLSLLDHGSGDTNPGGPPNTGRVNLRIQGSGTDLYDPDGYSPTGASSFNSVELVEAPGLGETTFGIQYAPENGIDGQPVQLVQDSSAYNMYMPNNANRTNFAFGGARLAYGRILVEGGPLTTIIGDSPDRIPPGQNGPYYEDLLLTEPTEFASTEAQQVVLTAPDDTRWRVLVDNSGGLSTTLVS